MCQESSIADQSLGRQDIAFSWPVGGLREHPPHAWPYKAGVCHAQTPCSMPSLSPAPLVLEDPSCKRQRDNDDDDGDANDPPRARKRARARRRTRLTPEALRRLSRDTVRSEQRTVQWVQSEAFGSSRGQAKKARKATAALGISSSASSHRRSRRSSKTSQSTRTNSIDSASSIHDASAAQILRDHQIYGPAKRCAPANLTELQEKMRRPRASVSPSRVDEAAWERYCRAYYAAKNEDAVTANFMQHFPGNAPYETIQNTAFRKMASLTPSARLPPVKPDIAAGLPPEDIDIKIRREIGAYVLTTNGDTPALVNSFTELKGPRGKEKAGLEQAAYDGAAGARAMHKMRSFGLSAEPEPDGNARTFVTSYMQGTTAFYASHMQSAGRGATTGSYHTYPLGGEFSLGSAAQFRASITSYRNLQDIAASERRAALQLAHAQSVAQQGPNTQDPAAASSVRQARQASSSTKRARRVESSSDDDSYASANEDECNDV